MRELSSDDEAEADIPSSSYADSSKPWKREFTQYLDVRDEVLEGMSLVQWWGVCLVPLSSLNGLIYIRSMHNSCQLGPLLLEITWQSWVHQFQASVLSLLLVLQ
jgi:hypothetical protein